MKFNAKGGVYDSPSLSSYSGGVYNSPQVFAFAKGAGVFGEAGPEAIMPLTRSSDGSLGVRAVGEVDNRRPLHLLFISPLRATGTAIRNPRLVTSSLAKRLAIMSLSNIAN